MLESKTIRLRPVTDADWRIIEEWGSHRDGLWGPFQRHQLDHVPQLREAYLKSGLLGRDAALLLMERTADAGLVGFVRYAACDFPDHDFPYPDIGFVVADPSQRGRGYAAEGVCLLVDYLFAGHAAPRIGATTDVANTGARRVLERVGFRNEGAIRQATYRDGQWRDVAIYGIVRGDWKGAQEGEAGITS